MYFFIKQKKEKVNLPQFEPAAKADYALLTNPDFCQKAANYSETCHGISTLVIINGKIVFEQYGQDHSANKGSFLASGTKSFSGIIAMMAQEEGLLHIDEKVSETITEWKSSPQKSEITIHQLLNLTSGLEASSSSESSIPTYAEAIKTPLIDEVGTTYSYGSQPFQVFGELMTRKLKTKNTTLMEYMQQKLFEPLGLIYEWWAYLDDQPKLPSGAIMTARNWALFGELIRQNGSWNGKQLISKESIDFSFQGSKANPAYGLCWWLNKSVPDSIFIPILTQNLIDVPQNPLIPSDLVLAAGSGKQRLYISREKNIVIVRQSNKPYQKDDPTPFRDNVFLSLIFSGKKPSP